MSSLQKIIVIVGPTASGKSALAVAVAKKLDGEIISADSRQIYRGLDIGTGKISTKEMLGVPHYMLDVIPPRDVYSASEYVKNAKKILRLILLTGKVPIIVGGTGFWIDALVGNISLSSTPPDPSLRAKLEQKSTETLFANLQKINPLRAKEIDRHNRRRLIRAIEIASAPTNEVRQFQNRQEKYDPLFIGISLPKETLRKNINTRTKEMLRLGLISEVEHVIETGTPKQRIQELGFEYSLPLEYLNKQITKKELEEKLNNKTWHYAKRQMTWLKRNKEINWIQTPAEAMPLVLSFLKK